MIGHCDHDLMLSRVPFGITVDKSLHAVAFRLFFQGIRQSNR